MLKSSSVIVTSVERMTTLNTTAKSPDPTCKFSHQRSPTRRRLMMSGDVAATMWTIIEPNIAILCACLPMCRMPLQRLFPRIFGSIDGTKRPGTTSFSHAGSSKNDWTPSQVGRRNPRDQFSSVVASKDSNSEEYILSERNKSILDASGAAESCIHKTTHISVKYDCRSETSGEQTPTTKIESTFHSNV